MKSYKHLITNLIFLLSVGIVCASGDASIEARINKVVRKAESYIGTPHRWGGTSYRGIDCSGLMMVSFAAGDIKLPRISRDQAREGVAVSRRNLRRGDLVFFRINGSKISHTGLVTRRIGSDVEFIHTSSSQGVMKSRLGQSYWNRRYSHGRRVWRYKRLPQRQPIKDRPVVNNKPRVRPTPTTPPRPAQTNQALKFPDLSTRIFRNRELDGYSLDDLTLMTMEIYAQNGYIFPTPKAQAYFESQPWYQQIRGKTTKRRRVKSRMNFIEKSNLKKIDKIILRKGG